MGFRNNKLRIFFDPDTENQGGTAVFEDSNDGFEQESHEEPREMAIPTTQEEIDNLTEEEIMSLQEHLNETEFSGKKQSGGNQPGLDQSDDNDLGSSQKGNDSEGNQEEQTAGAEGSGFFGLSDDLLNETPTIVLNKMKEIEAQFNDLGEFSHPDARKGFKKLLDDPVVQERLAILNGQKEDKVPNFDEVFSDGRLARLNIDFELNPNSGKVMRQLLQEAVRMGQNTARLDYQQQTAIAENRRKVESELNSVMALDVRLKSEKPFDDKSHPMRPFLEWAHQNRDKFNLIGIGGKRAYRMFLEEKGELTSFEDQIRKETRSNVQRGFKKVQENARTIPRGNQGNNEQKKVTINGVDPDKFRNDPDYRDRILDKHEGDLDMLHKLEKLFYPQ